ncbi:gypsy/ty3 retroelement polyprotein [Tanacetum coccineum]
MVGTRTSSLEVQIDEAARNWVTNHVESVVGPLNERLEGIAASLAQLMFNKTYGEAVIGAEHEEDALLNQVNITEAQAINMYIAGLLATIEMNVRMFKPISLEDAFSLSSLQKTTLALVKQRYNPVFSTPITTFNTFVNRNVTYPAKNTSTLALPAPISQTITKSNAMFGCRPRKMLKIKGEEEEVFENCLEEESSAMTEYRLSEEIQHLNTISLLRFSYKVIMVGTRTSSLEVQIDEATRNWVTNHVESVVCPLNERHEGIAASLAQLLVQQQYANRGDGNSRFNRLGKIEFPKFHGEDVKGWMFRVKQFFAIDAVGESHKIKLVSIHLYDRALTWHLQFIKTHGEAVTWAEYEEAVLKRFGDANEDAMAELKNLRLPAIIKLNVRMFKPGSLEDAFSLSSLQETLWPCQTATKSNAMFGCRPRKMLSQKEYDAKRLKNQCFYCNQKYIPGHKYEGQIFTIEIRGEEEEVFEDCLEEESSAMTEYINKNWVTNHVESVVGPLHERLEGIAASLAQLLVQQQYANRGDGNSRFSRLGKMEFPKFHREDVKGRMFRVKQFFAIDEFIKTYGEAVTWAEYEEAVLKIFGDANEDPMAELKNLRCKTTMKQYQSDFKALLNQVNITEAQAINMYIVGLPATIKINVRMFKPRSLKDAFSLSSLNVTYPAKNTSTLALPAPISQTITKSNAMFGCRPRKMLSQKKYDEKEQQYANKGDGNSRFSRLGESDKIKFGDANEDPMAELKYLMYKTTMKQYQTDFKALLNQVNITEAQAISMYIDGLPATVEMNVRMFKPRSLEDAFSLSSLQETTLALVKQSTLALPAPISQIVTKSNAMFRSKPRKMLSQKEYDEKRWRRVAASGVDEGGVMMRRLRWIGVVAVWRSEMYRVKEMVSDGVGGVVVKKWKGGDEIGGSWLGNLDEGVLGWRWGEGCGGLRGGEVVGGLRRWPESGQIPDPTIVLGSRTKGSPFEPSLRDSTLVSESSLYVDIQVHKAE